MLQSLRIRNYRGIRDLEVGGLGRLNLLVGKNGAGKTTLLESLVLLCSGGQPQLVGRLEVVRGLSVAVEAGKSARDLYWAAMFHNLDMEHPAVFEGVAEAERNLETRMAIERMDTRDISIADKNHDPFLLGVAPEQLVLRSSANGAASERRMILGEGAIRLEGASATAAIPFSYVAPHVADASGEAGGFAKLQQKKQLRFLLDPLRLVEPRIRGIEVSTAANQPVILCDIGLPELVPLSSLGGGILRLTVLLLSMASARGGVALIDEIEAGLHHSAMSTAWAAIQRAAHQFEVQVVATTHSLECVRAAHDALDDTEFRLIRVEQDGDEIRTEHYDPDSVASALDFEMEVR